MRYGGIEAGGTKWVCAVADGADLPLETETFPTTGPEETISLATRFFTANGPVDAMGVGAFGPLDIRPISPTWGTITTTPKPGWANLDLVSALRSGIEVLLGLLHPEFGHMRIPHDRVRDPFAGICPYHGDCLEGLASGEAIRHRWGRAGEDDGDERIWQLEAEYLALGLVNVICTLSPERIVLGGGVMKQPQLFPLVRAQVSKLLAGYFR